jgi:hypothetical protein
MTVALAALSVSSLNLISIAVGSKEGLKWQWIGLFRYEEEQY